MENFSFSFLVWTLVFLLLFYAFLMEINIRQPERSSLLLTDRAVFPFEMLIVVVVGLAHNINGIRIYITKVIYLFIYTLFWFKNQMILKIKL